MSYECHYTFAVPSTKGDVEDDLINVTSEYSTPLWKFSKIDGDPVLGPGVKCYLTSHNDDLEDMLEQCSYLNHKLKGYALKPIRIKIEKIVFDSGLMS